MAVADVSDPGRLLEIAERLEARALKLYEERKAVLAQAYEFRMLATEGERHVTVRPVAPAAPVRSRAPKAEATVRDIAYELTQGGNVFLQQDVIAAGVGAATASKWLNVWVERGMLTRERVGREWVYERVRYESEPVNRRRETPVELSVVRRERSRRVEGTGAGTGHASKIVGELAREARSQGLTTRKRKHKTEFVDGDGNVVAHASNTPGASSLKKTRGKLRQAGYQA